MEAILSGIGPGNARVSSYFLPPSKNFAHLSPDSEPSLSGVSMSSLPGPSSPGKRLAELLQEQQEPFMLELYVLKNGCSRRIVFSEPTRTCWPGGAWRWLRSLGGHRFARRREGLLGSLFSVLHHRRPPEASEWEGGASESVGGDGEIEVGNFCLYYTGESCSGRRKVASEGLQQVHADGERNSGWEGPEEEQQLSPVSVLELHADDASPERNDCGGNKEEKPSTLAIYLAEQDLESSEELRPSASSAEDLLEGSEQASSAPSLEEAGEETLHRRDPRVHHGQESLGSYRAGRITWSCVFTRRWQLVGAMAARDLVETDACHPFAKEIDDEIGHALLDDLLEEFLSHLTQPTVHADSNPRRCL